MKRQQHKRKIPKRMTKKMRGQATAQLMRMNGRFNKLKQAQQP